MWFDQLQWQQAAAEVELQLRRLRSTLKASQALAIVAACEKFTISSKTAQRGQSEAEDAIGMVGVVRRAAFVNEATMANLETPSASKAVASDKLLKALDLWIPGRKHVNDATRQAVLYALKNHLIASRWVSAVFG
jgi:hypothetical protein